MPAGFGLIATTVTTDDAAVEVAYPAGVKLNTSFMDEPMRVYDGEVTLILRFPQARKGEVPVKLTLTYQACDESACLPPVTKQLEIN